jgi:acyl-homoserine-lactone acylase
MKPVRRRYLALPLAALLLTASSFGSAGTNETSEILWDKYGVPHIFATTREDMFYAHGWAQMHGQANLLLRLYGESRGRAAEYWGQEYAALDRWLALNAMPDRAKVWYDAQTPTFRRYMDEFARGINDYAQQNPGAIAAELKVVLPVSGVDVVGHSLRVVHYGYIATQGGVNNAANAYLRSQGGGEQASATFDQLATADMEGVDPPALNGSNTWTVGPAKSASGNSMLLINPHLAWGNTFYRYMETHVVGPNYDLYGAPQVGFPVAVVGFNRRTGWGRTVNTLDTVDYFRLTLVDADRYLFDGQPRVFEKDRKVIKIKQPNGSFTEETIDIRRSVHGPVVYDQRGLTIAMKVSGIDRPKMLEQWFRMGEAQTLAEFQDALRMGSVPMWNANYADDQGHIMLVFNGLVARRNMRDAAFWQGVVPGDTSETLWTDYLTFDELPKSLDPQSGFNQNANEPPWLSTLPPLSPANYPPWVSTGGDQNQPSMRTLSSLRLMTEDAKITYQQFIDKKHSTRMELAERVLPDLFQAASSGTEAARNAAEAIAVLQRWDRRAEADSRGAALFQAFANEYLNQGLAGKMRVRYDPKNPVGTALGLNDPQAALAALAQAATEFRQTYGSLEVPYGDIYRFQSGNADVPGNGGAGNSGLFRTITFGRRVENKSYASHGETIVCAVEFGRQQQAQCLLSYGNSSQPGSPHLEDQLPLMTQKRLHPVWRERAEVEANLESRNTFATSGGGR